MKKIKIKTKEAKKRVRKLEGNWMYLYLTKTEKNRRFFKNPPLLLFRSILSRYFFCWAFVFRSRSASAAIRLSSFKNLLPLHLPSPRYFLIAILVPSTDFKGLLVANVA